MKSTIKQFITLTGLCAAMLTPASAAVIAGWDNDDTVHGSANWANTYSDANLTVSEVTPGAGLTPKTTAGGPGAAASMKYNSFLADYDTFAEADANNIYISFNVTAQSGFQFNLSNIQIATANLSVLNAVLNMELRSSADGFGSALDSLQITSNGDANIRTFDANLTDLTSVEMRLYLYWEAESANIHLRNDKTSISDFPDSTGLLTDPILLVNGSASPIPEPGSTALLGLGAFALILNRKK